MRILVASLLFLSTLSYAKTITVAVIDTGIDPTVEHLCKYGHKDFVANTPSVDDHGHGSHVSGLINQNAGEADYCLVSIRFYREDASGSQNLANLLKSIQYAINIKVDFINISGGGPEFNEQEYLLIKQALDRGIHVVVAAGNEHSDLDKKCNYFPACYDKRLVVVGNLAPNSSVGVLLPAPSSNFGDKVNTWEIGTGLKSNLNHGRQGYMSGTSQATAVHTGKLINKVWQLRSR